VSAKSSENSPGKGPFAVNRRDAIKLVGGGLLVWIYPSERAQAQDRLPSAYLKIGDDGTVTFYSGKIEMGQGIMTSLAQMAAEELDVPLSAMRAVMVDTDVCPVDGDGGTWGSLTTRNFGPALRTAAARARAVLIALASESLGLPKDQLFTEAGYVVSRADPTVGVSYATLAGGKTVEAQLDQTPKTKSFSQFTISGKPVLRLDAFEKVTGRAQYTADVRRPGMLYARILRPPAHGATLKMVDTTLAEQITGVQIVRAGALLAVVHEQPDVAARALALINAEYNLPQPGPDQETIYSYLVSHYPSGQVFGQGGNLVTGQQSATVKLEQTYYTPYVAHAPIEPHAAVASMEGTRFTVWASTQTPFTTKTDTQAARLITPYVGGGFGGKAAHQQAVEAAQIAKAIGKPVNLTWTREEEFFYDTFQPPSIIKISSGLGQNKKISFWDSQIYCVGNRGATLLYNVPNYRVRTYGDYSSKGSHPFELGPWRAPGNSANSFARESHIDGLAAAAGVDPLEFRLQHLTNTRLRNVLQQAAERFGWQTARLPSGRGLGLACGEDAGAYVVMMAQVNVDQKTGGIRVIRMLCAQDMGQVINPEGARQQMEGSMMMGMGYSLSEELHFANGSIQDLNFHKYAIPRFSWMPQLDTLVVENNALAPQGGGEPSIITVGAVLANAVFDAAGVRCNRLPMIPDRVLAFIQNSPTLAVQPPIRVGNQIQLSWNGGPGRKLQKTTSLTNPLWQDVPGTEGVSSIQLPATDATAYFRAIRP
jgi:nicotinate dehydrogenase subunit B